MHLERRTGGNKSLVLQNQYLELRSRSQTPHRTPNARIGNAFCMFRNTLITALQSNASDQAEVYIIKQSRVAHTVGLCGEVFRYGKDGSEWLLLHKLTLVMFDR